MITDERRGEEKKARREMNSNKFVLFSVRFKGTVHIYVFSKAKNGAAEELKTVIKIIVCN